MNYGQGLLVQQDAGDLKSAFWEEILKLPSEYQGHYRNKLVQCGEVSGVTCRQLRRSNT